MNTPVYREMVRLLNNKMNVSRNTVYNWFVKGSEYLKNERSSDAKSASLELVRFACKELSE